MQLPSSAELESAGPCAVTTVNVQRSGVISSGAECLQPHDKRYTKHVLNIFCQLVIGQHVIGQQQFTFHMRLCEVRYRPVQSSEVTLEIRFSSPCSRAPFSGQRAHRVQKTVTRLPQFDYNATTGEDRGAAAKTSARPVVP